MPTYTTTADDIINSVMQDAQVQTTNRSLLLDYVNRIHLRMLRETQWMFLQSDYQKFITKIGIDKYWIASGTAPNGYSDTGLQLADLESVLPESVFDLSNARALTQDSSQVRFTLPYVQRDGTLQLGPPRGYAYYQPEPGVMGIFPPPDNQNLYYPIPEPSLLLPVVGGSLATRTYYVVTTFVDSVGGEGTSSKTTSLIVPANQLLMAASPDPEVPSALSPTYGYWNVYVGTSVGGPFFKQNSTPLSVGQPWLEPTTGVTESAALASSLLLASPNGTLWSVTVSVTGQLQATVTSLQYGIFPVYLTDPYQQVWDMTVANTGQLTAGRVPFFTTSNFLILADSNGDPWQLTINGTGQLVATPTTLPTTQAIQPPTDPTIAPLQGYVIAFRYQKQKHIITQLTDILQIPDAYVDVVVAGVNYLVSLYVAKTDDENLKAPFWKKEFMDGMAQIRRDLRINYRNADFIGPDRTTQSDPYKSVWMYVF